MSLDATTLGTTLTTTITAALESAWGANPCAAEIASALGPAIANAVVAHLLSNAVVHPGTMSINDGDGATAVTGTGTIT